MARLFEEHLIRTCACLDGAWRMQADPCDVGESEQWNLGLPNGAFASVPSVFNLREGMLDYEGAVFYEKNFFFGWRLSAADLRRGSDKGRGLA